MTKTQYQLIRSLIWNDYNNCYKKNKEYEIDVKNGKREENDYSVINSRQNLAEALKLKDDYDEFYWDIKKINK